MEYKTDGGAVGSDLENVEVLLLSGGWLTEDRIRQLKNLRIIQSLSAGVDHLNFGIIPEKVVVCANAGLLPDRSQSLSSGRSSASREISNNMIKKCERADSSGRHLVST